MRLLSDDPPLLPAWVGQFRGGLCPHLNDSRAALRARFLPPPAGPLARASLYLLLARNPEQVGDPAMQHALALILQHDRHGVVVVADDGMGPSPLAWAGFRSRMAAMLGPRERARLFIAVPTGQGDDVAVEEERRRALLASTDVLLDPFPTGGPLEPIALALQACPDRGVRLPVVTLPARQPRSRPAMAVYAALLGAEALGELDPAAR